MRPNFNLMLTAIAPVIWGSTYYVTTEFLPADYPITVAMLRALPAGLLLLLIVRQLPSVAMLPKVVVLGALNFAVFWWLLFESAYRLPGGVAATLGAIQPLIVIVLSRIWLGNRITTLAILGALLGLLGIGILLFTPSETFSHMGIAAALASAFSMAAGTVLSRRWQSDISALTFTSWQLISGGLLLLPAALLLEPSLPSLTPKNLTGFIYLGTFGAAISYLLWFRGLQKLTTSTVSTLGFLSPVMAVLIGWGLLQQSLSGLQAFAIFIVLFSIWIGQKNNKAQNASPIKRRALNSLKIIQPSPKS